MSQWQLIYDCRISSIVRIFTEYLKWRWQEKRHLILSEWLEVFQWQLYIRLLKIFLCQVLHRIFEMEMTGKAAPHIVKGAWSISVTALYTIVDYHHLSGFSPNIWNGDDRKSDTSICQEGMKCFSNSFTYDCCISSLVMIFIDYLKWRWQEKRQPQFVKSTWSDLLTGFYTIVVYLHLSWSSSIIWNGDDRKSDTSICQEGLKCFSNSFIYDCSKSSLSRSSTIFWNGDDRKSDTSICQESVKCFSDSFLYVCSNWSLSRSSTIIWNGDHRKSDASICQNGMKCFSDSFIYDCWISSFLRIFTEYLKWRWQEKRHLNVSRAHEVFQ